METGGVRSARGVLINITGSSHLGLHEVNEACTLVREASDNDDVQISFGVVLDEDMGDEVKVTVIATGFTRESLPRIERKATRTEAAAVHQQIVEEPEPVPVYPAPVYVETPTPEPVHEEPAPMTMAAAATIAQVPSEPMFDDLEVPAILRSRRRGMVQ
jgi:cell division protein FtsZ